MRDAIDLTADEIRWLERTLVGLKARVRELSRVRPDVAMMSSGPEGGTWKGATGWVAAWDESTGLNELNERISAIEKQLALGKYGRSSR